MLLNLKLALLGGGVRQVRMAVDLGWDPSKLSRIVNETLAPSAEDKSLISAYLGVPESNLFSSTACVRPRSAKTTYKWLHSVGETAASRKPAVKTAAGDEIRKERH